MTEKAKPNKPIFYTIDFKTALPPAQCQQRFMRAARQRVPGIGYGFAPITQRVVVLKNKQFIIERTFPGAIHPIRLAGCLDPDPDSAEDGTWVHGAITHDTENQVLIEGLMVFLVFFLLTAVMFLRLKTRSFLFSLPVLLLMLTVMSLRWRELRVATEDLAHWVRRRLYVTPDQVRRNGMDRPEEATGEGTLAQTIIDAQEHQSRTSSNGK